MTGTSIRKQVFKLLAGYTILLFVSFCAVAVLFAFILEDEIIERLMIQQGNILVDQYELTGVYPTPALAGFKIYTSIDQMPVILLSQEVQEFPDPVTRFSASKREDEIGYLASCIETAVLDLNESLKRETDFTRDVSHELRTPLTILKNDVMTSAPGTTRDRQLAAIDQMDLTINNLLINGIRHSTNGQLEIDIVDGDLLFSNQHGESASPRIDIGVGIGQGLYLAQRICDALGWSMEVIRSEDSHQVAIKAPISR